MDPFLAWVVVILPTAFGIVCAIQALRPPRKEHHNRWFVIFIAAGVMGTSAVLWQQHRASKRADAERAALETRLNDLQQQLNEQTNRVLFQIKDVSVSFWIRVPLDHPALRDYRERVERCAAEILAAQTMRCGAIPHTLQAPIRDFFLTIGSQLYPNPQKELVAYALLDQASIDVGLFKDAKQDAKQVDIDKPDLRFRVSKQLDSPENNNFAENIVYVAPYYDIETKSLFVEGIRVPPSQFNWRTNGKIASLPDLPRALLVLRPSLSLGSFTLSGGESGSPQQAYALAQEISRNVTLERIKLYMSNGYEFEFSGDRLGKVGRDEQGFPFYLLRLVE